MIAACASRRAISASSLPSTYSGRTLIVAGRAYAARPRASRRRRLRLNVLLLRRSRSELWGAVARRRELLRPEVDEEEVDAAAARHGPEPRVNVVILLALVAPQVAAFGYLVIAFAAVVRARGDEEPASRRRPRGVLPPVEGRRARFGRRAMLGIRRAGEHGGMDAAHRPLIAVTTSEMRSAAVDVPRPPRRDPPRREMALGMRYLEAIERAGGMPVVVPPLRRERDRGAAPTAWTGVCLSGGPDIDPGAYGAEPDPELGPTEPALDAFELALARAADARGMPILGICRGAQLLNVARGGTLHQHLPDAVAARRSSTARPPRRRRRRTHVDVQPGSRLAARPRGDRAAASTPSTTRPRATSGRACAPSPGRPTGRSRPSRPPTGRFALGVQWHAECARPGARSTTPSSGPSSRPAAACRGGTLASVALT